MTCITNRPGYNNILTHLIASSGELTSGVSASMLSSPYYGPSVIMFGNSVPVVLNIFGQAITASTGIFFLPNAYDSFHFSVVPTTFTWIGK